MKTHRKMGRESVKNEFTNEHCEHLKKWFDSNGKFVEKGTPPSSRERLWNCFSLLNHNTASKKLAHAIILKTPIDSNHFEPIAAANLLLTFKNKLPQKVETYLLKIVREHLVNMMEVRFSTNPLHNFTSMGSLFLLATGQLLEHYEWKHEHASIPEVYTGDRITCMGLNSLQALAWCTEHEPVAHEFNSPTYSPISVHCMAKIVELIDHPLAKKLALQIEEFLWKEILSLYHPNLGVSCAPYSRAYRIDILNMTSQMRIMLAYTGISKDKSIPDLLDEKRKGILLHHNNDIPFVWSGPAWQISEPFHVPTAALEELKQRTFPKRFSANTHYDRFGYIDRKKHKYISLQGGVLPAFTSTIKQIQQQNYALGIRTQSMFGHRFPIMFHYSLKDNVRSMEDVRTVTAAVMFQSKPEEWVSDHKGGMCEAGNFNHCGNLLSKLSRNTVSFSGHPIEELNDVYIDELSMNTFIPTHFAPLDQVAINGQIFNGETFSSYGEKCIFRISDHGFVYEIMYKFPKPVSFKLYKWANFIRIAAFSYCGKKKLFSRKELKNLCLKGHFKIIKIRNI